MTTVTADRTAELQEAIDSANAEPFTTLEEAAAAELTRLWGDLHEAIGRAHGGCWSGECADVAYRIACLTKALGRAARWQDMQIELLETGVYQRMHDLMGVPDEQPDMAVVARMRAERDASLARDCFRRDCVHHDYEANTCTLSWEATHAAIASVYPDWYRRPS